MAEETEEVATAEVKVEVATEEATEEAEREVVEREVEETVVEASPMQARNSRRVHGRSSCSDRRRSRTPHHDEWEARADRWMRVGQREEVYGHPQLGTLRVPS